MIRALAVAMTALCAPAQAADFEFCWIGANGYRMEGTMRVPHDRLNEPLLDHDDITGFFIQGFKDDIPLGAWDLRQLTPDTSWNLSFDPRAMVFPTGGMHDSASGQAWNAGGAADDCGDPGFGFNSGTNAQDLCVKNIWRMDSMINRYTRFPVFAAGTSTRLCGGAPLLGQAPHMAQTASK